VVGDVELGDDNGGGYRWNIIQYYRDNNMAGYILPADLDQLQKATV